MFINIISICAPAITRIYGWIGAFGLVCAGLISKKLALSFLSFGSGYAYVPTMAGSWYFNTRNSFAHALSMVLCMLLFVVSPVGSQVSWYALYWFIPVGISFLSTTSTTYMRFLGTSWVMHACGTLCWVYSGFASPERIVALAWVVPFERILVAALMYGAYHMFIKVKAMRRAKQANAQTTIAR